MFAGQGLQPGDGSVLVPATDVVPMGHGLHASSRPLPAGQAGTAQDKFRDDVASHADPVCDIVYEPKGPT